MHCLLPEVNFNFAGIEVCAIQETLNMLFAMINYMFENFSENVNRVWLSHVGNAVISQGEE